MSFATQFADLIGNPVVARDVKYRGKTKALYFRELSAGEAEDLFLGLADDPKASKGLRARMIAACVCDGEGNPAMTVDEAAKLPNAFSAALQAICIDVNGLNDDGQAATKNAQ